jgi:hypothetical protein
MSHHHYTERPCPCGSGKPSLWQRDARGIPLCRTCDDCHEQKMKGYRPDVLTRSELLVR